MNDGYPGRLGANLECAGEVRFQPQIIPGHGEVASREHLAFFRGYLTDLIGAVKQAAADGASLDEMKRVIPDQLAPEYEQGMSKYPLGQYRDRIGLNIEMVYKKTIKQS